MRTDVDRVRGRSSLPTLEDHQQWEAVEDAAELVTECSYGEALLLLREVLRLQPRNPYAFYYVGVTLLETQHLEPARDAFRAATVLAPDYLGARLALSNVLRILGDVNGALAQAREALRRFPKDSGAEHAVALAKVAWAGGGRATGPLERSSGQASETPVRSELDQILETLGLGDNDEPPAAD